MIGQKRSQMRTQDPGVCRTGNAARRSRSARKVRAQHARPYLGHAQRIV